MSDEHVTRTQQLLELPKVKEENEALRKVLQYKDEEIENLKEEVHEMNMRLFVTKKNYDRLYERERILEHQCQDLRSQLEEANTRLEQLIDAADGVEWRFNLYQDSQDPLTQANNLVMLAERVFEMASWLPGFDPDRGEIVREDLG